MEPNHDTLGNCCLEDEGKNPGSRPEASGKGWRDAEDLDWRGDQRFQWQVQGSNIRLVCWPPSIFPFPSNFLLHWTSNRFWGMKRILNNFSKRLLLCLGLMHWIYSPHHPYTCFDWGLWKRLDWKAVPGLPFFNCDDNHVFLIITVSLVWMAFPGLSSKI